MSLGKLNEDFRDLLLEFSDEGVEFLLVGAFAVAFHGVPRATGDIDVFVRASPENAKRVHIALARFGAPLETPVSSPETSNGLEWCTRWACPRGASTY